MKPTALFPSLILASFIGCANENASDSSAASAAAESASEDTAEATMRRIMEGVQNDEPVVAWRALPESYQSDVNELVQTFGKNMDAQTWEQVAGLLGSVHKVLDTKQEFIFNHPGIAGGQDPESAKQGIVHATGLLKTILDGAGSLEKLKAFDGAEFMETTGAKVIQQISALTALAPKNGAGPVPLMALKDVKIETVESGDSSAKLKFVSAKGEVQQKDFVKFEGKWLPKEMVEDWEQNMVEARAGLAALPDQATGMRMQVMAVGGMISGLLTPMQSAENQEQFNTSVGNLIASGGMLLGPLMGGVPPEQMSVPVSESPTSLGDSAPDSPQKEEQPEPAGK